MDILKDKYCLLPIVRLTLGLHYLGIEPNTISLINGFIVTPLMLYFGLSEKFIPSLLLCYLRCVLDGTDGLMAREFKKTSQLGMIYDHGFDNLGLFINIIIIYINLVRLGIDYKLSPLFIYLLFSIIFYMTFTSDSVLYKLAYSVLGIGGSYDSYSTLTILLVCFICTFLSHLNINKVVK